METQHRVFAVGEDAQAAALHVWVWGSAVRLALRLGDATTKCDVRAPLSGWWKIAGDMSALDGSTIHPSYPKIYICSDPLRDDRVSWEARGPRFQWGIELPRQTWIDVCAWVTSVYTAEGK